jgi:hypothetical protein
MNPCQRKCHDCGNVAMHEDSVTPWVLCKKCGSQDTRLTMSTEQVLEAAQVGALLARCLHATIQRDFYGTRGVGREWVATVNIDGSGYHEGEGPTQLAAIKAAVEAAEKGVRE